MNLNFLKKKEDAKNQTPVIPVIEKKREEIPLKQVELMKSQNLTNAQISQNLSSEGYSFTAISKAMEGLEFKKNRADSKEPVTPQVTKDVVKSPQISEWSDAIQELVEAIIDERISDLSDKLNSFKTLSEDFDEIVSGKVGNIQKIENRLTNVETEIKNNQKQFKELSEDLKIELSAMEKAFHKLIPQLSSSIRKLKNMETVEELEKVDKNLDSKFEKKQP